MVLAWFAWNAISTVLIHNLENDQLFALVHGKQYIFTAFDTVYLFSFISGQKGIFIMYTGIIC